MRRITPRLSLAAALLLALAALATSCSNSSGSSSGGGITIDHSDFDPGSLPDTDIAKAAALKVYFEHASVGEYMCAGIEALSASESRYSSGRNALDSSYDASWFASNSDLEDNMRGNPGEAMKISDFQSSLADSDLAGSIDLAMFKFCYIDSPTDASALFASVKSAMEGLEAAHPALTLVWWTMPIETSSNAERQEYNDLVRNYCSAKDKWLFDIADLESHDESGTSVVDGDGRELLAAEYSLDGGHPNSLGSAKLAKAYWRLLAEIAR